MTRTFKSGKLLPQHLHGGQRFQRRHVSRAGHHHVGLAAAVVAGPFPDAKSRRAMFDGRIHVEPLQLRLFAADDHVHVIPAAQAMVGHRQQRVGVRRQIDADHFGLLVHDVINETRVLMAEAVVILPPHQRTEQIIQRRNRPPPRNVPRHLQPFRVLVEHRIHDVNERLVAGKEAVPAGEQIAFQPAFALMLAQHLHHPAIRRTRARRSGGSPPSSSGR